MTSKEYWQKRETEHAKKNKMSEQAYAEEIRKTYAYMADQIQKEIDGFYTKYATKEGISLAEAKRRVSKLDIEEYGRKAAKYVKEKDFSDQANEEMRLYNSTMKINRLELLKANIGLEMVSGFDELQKYFDRTLTQQTIEEFRRQAGILGNSVQENGKMARTIVDASFHNATYSDRIWMYQDMLKAELDKLLKTGLIQGKNPRELAVHLQKRFGASREDAERLMVTELARVQTEAQKQSYLRNGFEEYTYVACGNADVCERCQALDGKHFKVRDMMPGTNAPPMHPRCHCSTAAYMDSAEYEKWLEEQESVEKIGKTDIINSSNGKEEIQVHAVGKINRDIYKCVTEDIITNEVIVTDERIQHIKERHPNDYERFYSYLPEIIANPDYIIKANKPDTATVLKEIIDNGEKFQLVLRLVTSKDKPEFKNSIITFLKINERTWNKYLRNKEILYKRD